MKKIAISALLFCGLCFSSEAMAQCAKQDINGSKSKIEQCCKDKAVKQEVKSCCKGKVECDDGKVDGVTSSTAVTKNKPKIKGDCCKANDKTKQCCKQATTKSKKAEKKAKKAAAKAKKVSKKTNKE